MIKTVVVTGSNRGIGLGLVKNLLAHDVPPKLVIATCRDPSRSQELLALQKEKPNLKVVQFEVNDFESHSSFAAQVADATKDDGLDVLINNAGIFEKVSLKSGSPQLFLKNLEVNTVAPFMMVRTLLNQLIKSGKQNPSYFPVVANISAELGSITMNTVGGSYAYRASKTALNQVTKGMHHELEKYRIRPIALHPGWVQTDMGGTKAPTKPEESASGLVNVIRDVHSGKVGRDSIFMTFEGKVLPW